MISWLKKQFKKILIGLGILGVASAGTLIGLGGDTLIPITQEPTGETRLIYLGKYLDDDENIVYKLHITEKMYDDPVWIIKVPKKDVFTIYDSILTELKKVGSAGNADEEIYLNDTAISGKLDYVYAKGFGMKNRYEALSK